MNNDDDIRQLFTAYHPTLSSGFMESLDAKLRAVESIKEYQREESRRTRRAMILAALCGAVTGGLLMYLLPDFTTVLTRLDMMPVGVINVLAWLPVAAGTVLAGIGATVLFSAYRWSRTPGGPERGTGL